jgi:hypothetical protein
MNSGKIVNKMYSLLESNIVKEIRTMKLGVAPRPEGDNIDDSFKNFAKKVFTDPLNEMLKKFLPSFQISYQAEKDD